MLELISIYWLFRLPAHYLLELRELPLVPDILHECEAHDDVYYQNNTLKAGTIQDILLLGSWEGTNMLNYPKLRWK